MSLALYDTHQLKFWSGEEIAFRNMAKATIVSKVSHTLESINLPTRVVLSERLPHYSISTNDVEVLLDDKIWREMASISERKDFPDEKYKVLEIAVGLDRLVSVVKL